MPVKVEQINEYLFSDTVNAVALFEFVLRPSALHAVAIA